MPQTMSATDITSLYSELLTAWNQRDAATYARRFAPDGHLVGFDGSTVDGREAIAAHLEVIFADHQTASYVSKVRDTRFLAPGVALLRAAVGMVPPGSDDLNPDEAVRQLTDELRGELAARRE